MRVYKMVLWPADSFLFLILPRRWYALKGRIPTTTCS